jgi:hypothetical protein
LVSELHLLTSFILSFRLHKTVFPRGIEAYSTPSTTPAPSRSASSQGLASTSSKPAPLIKIGLFGRLVSGAAASVAEPRLDTPPDGPLEEMIVSGAAFGNSGLYFMSFVSYIPAGNGLFNLVLSLLPAKMRFAICTNAILDIHAHFLDPGT